MSSPAKPWHALNVNEVLTDYSTSSFGLNEQEAVHRLQTYGPNHITPPKGRSAFVRFLRQFHNVLIYVLLASATVTAALGHWVDSGVIIGVVLINALIGFIQEGKAERALYAIRHLLSLQAMVLRDGHPRTINAEQLVPGDIVLLQSGDRVPADLRLLHQKNLHIDEALLTGESMPVEKSVTPVVQDQVIAERNCMAWSGTFVTYGQGTGIVVATGDATELGRISQMLKQVEPLTTPLLRQLDKFGHTLTFSILLLSVITFLVGYFLRNYPVAEVFMTAVGIAVAAIPEGLPAILTITLAIGVQRMAKNNTIIRRLPAVETLGSVTVICTDKTGTLTRNEMMVVTLVTAEKVMEVSGSGYEPRGVFTSEGKLIEEVVQTGPMDPVRAVCLCNDAALEHKQGEWLIHGDPTEGALIVLAMKAGLELSFEKENCPRMDIIPFESEHRYMATLHHDHTGQRFIYIKGAPEKIFEICKAEWRDGKELPLQVEYWLRQIENMAQTGQRILAVAIKSAGAITDNLTFSQVEGGFTLLGLFGMLDPPRAEAIESVKQCHEAGIRVVMITGDHAATARAIGAQLGVGDGRSALSGGEIDRLDDAQLGLRLQSVDVIARASPEHKLRLVRILQGQGHIVAMTGDGVNDAPALKRANVGIAMGCKGTEVAREAAEMVLADDNFASIALAVKEGRAVYDNLKKSILFLLPTDAAEALLLVIAIATGYVLPITPVQILWVNMITTVTLALALAFEPPEAGVMQRPPRNPGEGLLTRFLIWRILFVSMIVVTGCFGLFLWYEEQGVSIEYARTVTVNTIVMFEMFYLFNSRYIYASVLSVQGLIGNPYILLCAGMIILFQMLFTYVPFMQNLFDTVSLKLYDWYSIFLVAFVIFILAEFEKILTKTVRH